MDVDLACASAGDGDGGKRGRGVEEHDEINYAIRQHFPTYHYSYSQQYASVSKFLPTFLNPQNHLINLLR